MTPASLIVYGRYWYDFFTLAWVVGFFLIEMLLLFRNSVLGWAMTAKCIVLAVVFSYAIVHPAYPLPPEEVTFGAVAVRLLLVAVLGFVIAVLLWMRWRRQTIIVGRKGTLP